MNEFKLVLGLRSGAMIVLLVSSLIATSTLISAQLDISLSQNLSTNATLSNATKNTIITNQSNGTLSALEDNKGKQGFNNTLPLSIIPKIPQNGGQKNDETLESANVVTGEGENGKEPGQDGKDGSENKQSLNFATEEELLNKQTNDQFVTEEECMPVEKPTHGPGQLCLEREATVPSPNQLAAPRPPTITGEDIFDNSITGADIKDGTIRSSDLSHEALKFRIAYSDAEQVRAGSTVDVSASCAANEFVIGGGYQSNAYTILIYRNGPAGNGWTVGYHWVVDRQGASPLGVIEPGERQIKVYAICASFGSK